LSGADGNPAWDRKVVSIPAASVPARRPPRDPTRWFARAVIVGTTLFFAVFLVWPVLQVVTGGFVDADGRITAKYLIALIGNPIYLAGLGNALGLAATTTFVAIAIALPLAWVNERYLFPARRLLGSLVLLPMILPPFVGAIGIKQIFGQYGACNALLHHLHLLAPGATIDWFAVHPFWGITLVQAFSLYPIVYLNATAALANVDPALEEVAENLGCTGWRRFRRITLPLIRPGLFAGATIVFIWAFTELGTPLVFDYTRVTSVQIYEGLKDIGANPFPYALVALTLFVSIGLYVLGRGVFGRAPAAMAGKATHGSSPRSLPSLKAWGCTVFFAAVTGLAVLPHLGVVLLALARDWYGTLLPAEWTTRNLELALGHTLTVPAIANSLRFAAASTVIDIVLGTAIAYVIVRSHLRSRHLLDALAMLPLAVPGLILAFGYVAMAQDGHVWGFLNPTRNPTILLIVAYAIRRLPYVVRSAAAGFEQTSETFEEAAQSLGCPPLKSVVRVTLPLITANLIAGGLLAFAFAMLEVSDSLILAQKQAYYPITKAILELFQLLGDGRFIASALGLWAMVFLGLIVAWLSLLLGKKLGALFRL
jgi:iron(III) transport system permease protein